MRLKLALSATVASLLFSAPVFAGQEPAANQEAPHGKEAKRHRGMARMEHRLNRAVEHGRLTREQADQFISEARQLRDEALALRQAGGGQLTEEQRQQFKQRKHALREKVRAAMKATRPQAQ